MSETSWEDGADRKMRFTFSTKRLCTLIGRACSSGPAILRYVKTAWAAAIAKGCRTKVPAKNVTPVGGDESSPYCQMPTIQSVHICR